VGIGVNTGSGANRFEPAAPTRCPACGKTVRPLRGIRGMPICGECNRARNLDVLFPRGNER